MEKRVLFFLVVILFVNVVSATYGCSNGTVTEDDDVVSIGQIESFSKIKIALIDSSSGQFSAEFLMDVALIKLTSASPSAEAKLLEENYNVSLVNITDDSAWISIGGKKKKVDEKKLEQIGGLQTYMIKIDGTYPGSDANVELFVGEEYAFLHSNSPTIKKTFDGVEYSFELISSSSSGARISVKNCKDGKLIEVIDEPEVNESLQNDSVQNQSEDTSSSEVNTTITEDVTDPDNLQNVTEQNIDSSVLKNSLIYAIVAFVFIVIIGFFLYKKIKENDSKIESEPEE